MYIYIYNIYVFLYKQHFYRQHPLIELLLFKNYLLSLSTLSFKIIGDVFKNVKKTNASVLMTVILMAIKIRLKMKSKS